MTSNSLTPSARRAATVTALLGAAVIVLSACASTPAAEEGADPSEDLTPAAEALAPNADEGASGDVAFCGGKDTGIQSNLIESFNASQSAVTATYIELGADTDAARTAAIQRLEGGAADCDIYMTDVTWTPEWALQGWLYDQTDLVAEIAGDVMPSVLETTVYDGRNWSTPFYTNAALILYRDDKVDAPATWKDLYAQAASSPEDKLFLQAKPYEGLTVNFLELLYSAGGEVLGESGEILIDSEETRTALEFMRDGFEDGAIDRASLTYDETAARRAFESGEGAYQRNWPNSYASALETPVGENVEVAALPAFDEDNEPAGVLGGWNLAVPLTAKNPEGAAAFIKYTVGAEFQKQMFLENAQAPVIADIYSDPDVTAALPFAETLRDSLESSKPRPKSPVYAQISRAIYTNVYAVLNEGLDIDEAVDKMVAELETAQETF